MTQVTQMGHHLIGPCSLQLVEIHHHSGTVLLSLYRQHTYPVAYLYIAKHLMLSGSLQYIVAHRVSAAVGQEHHHTVGTSHAGKSVDGMVALGRLRRTDGQVDIRTWWAWSFLAGGKQDNGKDEEYESFVSMHHSDCYFW